VYWVVAFPATFLSLLQRAAVIKAQAASSGVKEAKESTRKLPEHGTYWAVPALWPLANNSRTLAG
jgi:hypothetical protein